MGQRRRQVTAQAYKNAMAAMNMVDVKSFEELDALYSEDDLCMEDVIPDLGVMRQDGVAADLLLFKIGYEALRAGVDMRAVLVWLYCMHGFRLHEVAKRFGISSERVRQLRIAFERVMRGVYGQENLHHKDKAEDKGQGKTKPSAL